MRKQKGFTLIELLTVISIIVILMSILLPSLSGIRRRAKATACLSNLRQWGMVYKMYTDEFDGKLPRNYGEFPWYYPIRNYYSDERKLLLCPVAKKASDPEGTSVGAPYGGTIVAWGLFSPPETRTEWDRIGSYGLNSWTYEPEREEPNIPEKVEPAKKSKKHRPHRDKRRPRFPSDNDDEPNEIKDISRYWETAYEKGADNIPLVFDNSWLYSFFDDNAGPPSSEDRVIRFFGFTNTTCIDRHDGGINMVFMDFSTRKVGLKELWTIKWHKNFNTAGKWTQAGGVQPENWPNWMRTYKDY